MRNKHVNIFNLPHWRRQEPLHQQDKTQRAISFENQLDKFVTIQIA